MKIAFVVSEFPVTSETFIVNQITDLIDRGHNVRIFAFRENKEAIKHKKFIDYNLLDKTTFCSETKNTTFKYFQFLNFILQNFNNINFSKFYKKFNFFQYQKKSFTINTFYNIRWILTQGKFDIIHAHFGPNGVYIAEIKKLGFYSNCKFITTFHGYDLNAKLLAKLKIDYKNLFREVDLMTVNTIYAKKLLEKIAKNKNIKILPVGVDIDHFKRNTYKETEIFNIIFVGRFIKLKAPGLAVEILHLLINRGYKNVRMTLVGDGELKFALNELIDSLSLQNFVNLTGALAQEEVVKKMEDSHLLIMPGIYDEDGRAETQGLVIQEAQAMELPVLVSDVGGMKYGVIEGETGFIIEEKNSQAFADKIEQLINDKKFRTEMGRKGRKFVQENYSLKMVGSKLENLYFRVLNN